MTDFYKTMNDIFTTGKIPNSKTDLQFSDRLRSNYGIEVLCSDFYTTKAQGDKAQGKLLALIDGRKTKNNTIKLIGESDDARNWGIHLNSSELGKRFQVLANDMIKWYTEISGSGCAGCDDIVVTVYDFVARGVGYIYWMNLPNVRSYMNKNYNVRMCDTIGTEDSEYIVLVDRLCDFVRIIENKNEICKSIFAMMKKDDHFNLLRYDELRVSFLLKESLNYKVLNMFLMRQSLC